MDSRDEITKVLWESECPNLNCKNGFVRYPTSGPFGERIEGEPCTFCQRRANAIRSLESAGPEQVVKPLRWESDTNGEFARTPFGIVVAEPDRWTIDESSLWVVEGFCESIEDGKAQAEARWQSIVKECLQPAKAQVPEWVRNQLSVAARQYRHNTDNSTDISRPTQGFVVAYDKDEVGQLIADIFSAPNPPQEVRFTHDNALAECPCCGSLDVGAAGNTVNCYGYGCGLSIEKSSHQEALDAWNTRSGKRVPNPPQQAPNGWREILESVRSGLTEGGEGWAQEAHIEAGNVLVDSIIDEFESATAAAPNPPQETEGARANEERAPRSTNDITCECGRQPRETYSVEDDAGVSAWRLADRCSDCLDPHPPQED